MKLYYEDDKVKLYLGDSQSLDLIPNKSINLIVTDPPWGADYVSGHRQEKFDPITYDKYYPYTLMQKFLYEAYRVSKPRTAIYVFTGWNSFPKLYPQVAESFRLGHPIAWIADNWSGGFLEGDWANRVGLIIYAHRHGHHLRGGRPSNALFFKRVAGNKLLHPTQKPIGLLEYLISKSSDFGDTVLDCFCGSGSTLVAALQTGRKAIGVDIEERQLEIAEQRIRQLNLPQFDKVEVADHDFELFPEEVS